MIRAKKMLERYRMELAEIRHIYQSEPKFDFELGLVYESEFKVGSKSNLLLTKTS